MRSPDNAVRRAVGASRATVRNAALLEAVAIAAIGAGTGSIVGVGVSRLAVAEWPGGLGGYQAEASVVVVLAIVGVVLASALLFGFLRSGGIAMELSAGVPSAIVLVIQGLVILLLAGSAWWLHRRKRA